MTGRRDAAEHLLESSLSRCRDPLLQAGRGVEMSGSIRWSEGLLALHSDYGPTEQDKPANQDYALAWVGSGDPAEHPVLWAAALADGVTSSFRPEWGARLACWSALAHLVTRKKNPDPEERAKLAIGAAGEALGTVAQRIADGGDEFRPEDEFPATWRRRIERGRLLQTTLTLAWLENGVLNLAIVGDGGGALRRSANDRAEDLLLVGGEPETAYVHALGPANRHVERLDIWQQRALESGTTVALYTDGIRAAVGMRPGLMLDRLSEVLREASEENVAEVFVRELASSGREESMDNLTLLVASRQEAVANGDE